MDTAFKNRAQTVQEFGPWVRIALIPDKNPVEQRAEIQGPQDLWKIARAKTSTWDHERFCLALLDANRRLLGFNEVAIGSLNEVRVHLREVTKPLILANADAFICFHNHPGGDPAPSSEDVSFTKHLQVVGMLLGIPMLDHVILGSRAYYSFFEAGNLMEFTEVTVAETWQALTLQTKDTRREQSWCKSKLLGNVRNLLGIRSHF